MESAQHALNAYGTSARHERESDAMTAKERTRMRQSTVGPVLDAFVAWSEKLMLSRS